MEVVSFEIAKKLEEKGFPQHKHNIIGLYNEQGEFFHFCLTMSGLMGNPNVFDRYFYVAPTISQVLKWLRDKEIYVVPTFCVDQNDNGYWDFRIINLIDGTLIYDEIKNRYSTYELAAIAGINYIIDNNLI